MRAMVLIAGFSLASGATMASCALDSAEAVDEMLDSAVYIMAGIVRCEDKDQIRCALDVSEAIHSVNGMVNVILKAVEKCGSLDTPEDKCGLAVGRLTESMAGLAAASTGIIAKCPNQLNGGAALDTVGSAMQDSAKYGGAHPFKTAGFSNGLGQCVINVKDSMKSLFLAISRIMTIKTDCDGAADVYCAHNGLKVVSSLAALAEHISGAIGKCTANHQADAVCAQMSARLFHAVSDVGRASTGMNMGCSLTEAERLYLADEKTSMPASDNGSITFALAALLPLTAVLSFVGGSRLSKSRSEQRDLEMVGLQAEE